MTGHSWPVHREHALQWSRPQLRTETFEWTGGPSTVTWLQWSRPQLRTETANQLDPRVKEVGLQWSRPQLRTETGVCCICRANIRCFNGAVLS